MCRFVDNLLVLETSSLGAATGMTPVFPVKSREWATGCLLRPISAVFAPANPITCKGLSPLYLVPVRYPSVLRSEARVDRAAGQEVGIHYCYLPFSCVWTDCSCFHCLELHFARRFLVEHFGPFSWSSGPYHLGRRPRTSRPCPVVKILCIQYTPTILEVWMLILQTNKQKLLYRLCQN